MKTRWSVSSLDFQDLYLMCNVGFWSSTSSCLEAVSRVWNSDPSHWIASCCTHPFHTFIVRPLCWAHPPFSSLTPSEVTAVYAEMLEKLQRTMWLNSESQTYVSWLSLLELHSRTCEALLITGTDVSFILLGLTEVSCSFQSGCCFVCIGLRNPYVWWLTLLVSEYGRGFICISLWSSSVWWHNTSIFAHKSDLRKVSYTFLHVSRWAVPLCFALRFEINVVFGSEFTGLCQHLYCL